MDEVRNFLQNAHNHRRADCGICFYKSYQSLWKHIIDSHKHLRPRVIFKDCGGMTLSANGGLPWVSGELKTILHKARPRGRLHDLSVEQLQAMIVEDLEGDLGSFEQVNAHLAQKCGFDKARAESD